jgi:hypothetical protein
VYVSVSALYVGPGTTLVRFIASWSPSGTADRRASRKGVRTLGEDRRLPLSFTVQRNVCHITLLA